MLALLLALQVNTTAAPRISARDSVALRERLEQAEFRFMLDWRYLWQNTMRDLFHARKAKPLPSPDNYGPGLDTRLPTGACGFEMNTRHDTDRNSWGARLIRASRPDQSLCLAWFSPRWYEPSDERKSIDASLTIDGFPPDAADSVRAMRVRMIAMLDSAARRLPGDPWIAGQRVRLKVDQQNHGDALKAARDCQAEFWWCFALQGYVQFAGGDVTAASLTFDKARPLMPDSLRCAWDDASQFFSWSGRVDYGKLPCAKRDSVNALVWWLADPLYIENGNERRTEHYARQVFVALRTALDVDERFDWRENYQGPALREMVIRYGWPTHITTCGTRVDPKWVSGNTRSLPLGDSGITRAGCAYLPNDTLNRRVLVPDGEVVTSMTRLPYSAFCVDEMGRSREDVEPVGFDFPCNPLVIIPGTRYWGPQFSTIPLWQTVLDPFHATDEGWDLAPPRDAVGPFWDTSWWAQEFYRRDSGPLVPLMSQHAFFRRQRTAILAANMQWDTIAYLTKPLDRMVAATMITKGPNLPMAGAKDTMSGKSPRPLVSQVPSGPALLAIEMIPRALTGPAARTRFGVDVPQPLGVLTPGEIALSDIVLASTAANESAIESMVALMPRMLGSTVLREPRRVALFWELYGLGTGDTVDVSLRIIRKRDANSVQQLGAILGIGSVADDSVVQTWREPRSGDPMATMDGNISIRPRSVVVDMSALPAARYSVEVQVKRGVQPPAVTKREFRIERR